MIIIIGAGVSFGYGALMLIEGNGYGLPIMWLGGCLSLLAFIEYFREEMIADKNLICKEKKDD